MRLSWLDLSDDNGVFVFSLAAILIEFDRGHDTDSR